MPPPLPNSFLIIDIEASGLHQTSFPIEVAWTGPNTPTQSFLIKPDASWAMADWDDAAQDIHNISLAEIMRDGVDPKIIIKALLSDAAGKTIISDGVAFDQNWLRMLFEAAGQPHTIMLQDFTSWLGQQAKHLKLNPTQLIKTLQQFEEEHHPVHRAADDVERLLQLISACLHQD
jgi:DNA polymerase III epsilon subunit-like protein